MLLFVMPKRRKLMEAQLLACFPERSARERDAVARQSIAYLSQALTTFVRIPTMKAPEMDALVETEGFHHIEEAFRQKKGMITFTAHYGFWELMAIYVTRLYPDVSMVVRPLDNPKLDRLISGVRGSGGGGVIDSKKVFREGLRLLRRNGILGILIDQNFHKGGVFVDFFGRPAATNTLVPILARRTGCAVLPMHNVWKGEKIRIICEAPVTLSANPDQNAAIGEDTQMLTRIAERWIREDPSQWLWLHNRWKRRPLPGEPIIGV
jgi:KDO2-lipid IV(A) lauroyltransferase